MPVEQRVIELEIDPDTELSDMQQLLKAALGLARDKDSVQANLLLDLLAKGDKFSCMQSGKCETIDSMSPLQAAPLPTAADTSPASDGTADPDVARRQLDFAAPRQGQPATANEQNNENEVNVTPAGPYEMRKTRTATQVFEPTEKIGKKNKSATNKRSSPSNDSVEPHKRRAYNKTGMYSKNPVKAAMARSDNLTDDGGPEGPKKNAGEFRFVPTFSHTRELAYTCLSPALL